MTNNTLFNLKTLFDPLSDEWRATGFQEKRDLISKIFSKASPYIGFKSAAVKIFLIESRDPNPLDENASMEEYGKHMDKVNKENPEIPLENLILAVGLYLNKSFMPDFNFPVSKENINQVRQDMEKLKDGRTKRRKEVDDYFFSLENNGNSGRELFDVLSNESKNTSIEEKRIKIQKIADAGFMPIEILNAYFFRYNSMENHDDIVKEAPLSAFELLWVDNKLIL